MGLVVPDEQELEVITARLTPPMTIKLYGNNKVPAGGDTASGYTEIAGGGYTSFPLLFGNWTITGGNPTAGVYNATQVWNFTGVISGPGTVYGYFVTRDSDGKLMFAERFPALLVPFTPIAGSVIRVLPRYSVQSLF